MKGRNKTTDLYQGICVLIPANCEFTMQSTGDESLTMYLINEPIPAGFRPNDDILVKDENTMAVESTNGHWCHIVKNFFETDAGLGTLERVLTVSLNPMTIGHPHSHVEGCEEVWTAARGESIAFLGKQIRKQPEGTGYMIPPDGNTPHANINTGTEQITFFYFARYRDHEVRK
jgi:mannose-6-phosphate isomerase-like protein (cupin superfamily)